MQKILISGLSGGSGKTIVSLGLSRFFTARNYSVYPFKKGPDYIDAAWLSEASHKPCYCLDPFFMTEKELAEHFFKTLQTAPADSLAIIEGNRGLYDGKDYLGSCSTAQLAHALDCPVLLTVNCAKITRTTAALILGMQHFDPNLQFAGVILNNTAFSPHEKVIRKSIEEYTDIPVLGSIPRQRINPIPERHLGLCRNKKDDTETILNSLAQLVAEYTDTDKILAAMQRFELPQHPVLTVKKQCDKPLHIAYLYDDAFWFYYQENFDALEKAGAACIALSLLSEKSFAEQLQAKHLTEQDIDGLYIGGGYPELFAKQISTSPKLTRIKNWIENNMPVYAECGGFMLLAEKLHFPENGTYKTYPMTGIFPVETKFFQTPQGLGYTEVRTLLPNPYHPRGNIWKGHEFHFSTAVNCSDKLEFFLELTKGHGMVQKENLSKEISPKTSPEASSKISYDGLLYKNCFASYTHLYAPAVPHFARNFIHAAQEYQKGKQ